MAIIGGYTPFSDIPPWISSPGNSGEVLHLALPRSPNAANPGGSPGIHLSDKEGWEPNRKKKFEKSNFLNFVPSGKLTVSYWKWPLIVDFPIKNGWIFHSYVSLPEGKLFDLVIEPPNGPFQPIPMAQCRQVHLDVLRVLCWVQMGSEILRV